MNGVRRWHLEVAIAQGSHENAQPPQVPQKPHGLPSGNKTQLLPVLRVGRVGAAAH